MNYSFLRSILKISGWVDEDIDQVMRDIEINPERYQELLTQLEEQANKKAKINENY